MFSQFRAKQFETYNRARLHFCKHPEQLIELERFLHAVLRTRIEEDIHRIRRDYNEASYLYPFWQNYPPDARGNHPVGDQFPWIEVGEHALGERLFRYLHDFTVLDTGIPTGADQRFVIKSDVIAKITGGFTNSAWLHIDIKSAGPRDDFDHTVMSHNQVSGDGLWTNSEDGLRNTILKAVGARAQHDFHCSVPPIYVLSDDTIAPVVTMVIKPVYAMLGLAGPNRGQPLSRLTFASIPNGLLLCVNPAYLKSTPGLLFPGKDDKDKNPFKIRARVHFPTLRAIAAWRVTDLAVALPA